MFGVSRSGLDEAFAALERLQGDLPRKALADALNHTANTARINLRAEMQSVFDRPTPFTLNSIRILHAKGSRLESALWVKDEDDGAGGGFAPEDWIKSNVFGGGRELKKSEVMLRAKGILPSGRFITPGKGARLDQYGNMSRGHMTQILSGLSAYSMSGSSHNATGSRRSARKGHAQAFYVAKKGNTPIGIMERRGGSAVMVLAFVSQPQYRKRFDFSRVASEMSEREFETHLNKAIVDALGGRL